MHNKNSIINESDENDFILITINYVNCCENHCTPNITLIKHNEKYVLLSNNRKGPILPYDWTTGLCSLSLVYDTNRFLLGIIFFLKL